MKVFIYSHSPLSPSGYGQQTKLISKNLTEMGHEVDVAALDYNLTPISSDFGTIFPTRQNIVESYHDLYYWARKYKPDVIVQLFDAWVIGKPWITKEFPVITYNPVDSTYLPRNFIHSCAGSSLHLAMTKSTQTLFNINNLIPNIYLPHMVDQEEFYPCSKNEARQALGIDPTAFIFGLFGTNLTARKNIPSQIMAFAKVVERNKDKNIKLLLHTATYESLPSAYDIPYIIKSYKMEGKVICTDQHQYLLNDILTTKMRLMYNAIDVLLMFSLGEGFGIPIIEAQACGTPVLGTSTANIKEVIGKGGSANTDCVDFCDSGHMGWWKVPCINDIIIEMEATLANFNLKQEAIKNAAKYNRHLWKPAWEKALQTAKMQ